MLDATAGKVVLITGINYWPEETGNAPYTTLMAEHFAAKGHQVHVVTGMPYYPSWHVSQTYGRVLRKEEIRNKVHIHRFRQFVPDTQTAFKRAAFEASFVANALAVRHIPRPDIVLGIVPSLGGACLAYAYSRRFRVPYGLIFQDLVGAAAVQCGIPGGNRVAKLTTGIEGAMARNAALISTISPGFKPYLASLGVDPSRIRQVPNWAHISPPKSNRESIRAELGWHPDKTIVLHAGAMGLKQGLENVINTAQAASKQPHVHFVLMGDGNQRDDLERRALGLTNLAFLPPADAETFPDILAAADVLIINERATMRDMALPSKLTSYLVAGRPIVAAVSSEGWTAREVIRTGAGLVVPPEDPEALLQSILDLATNPRLMEQLGKTGQRYAHAELGAAGVLDRYLRFINDIHQSAGDRQ